MATRQGNGEIPHSPGMGVGALSNVQWKVLCSFQEWGPSSLCVYQEPLWSVPWRKEQGRPCNEAAVEHWASGQNLAYQPVEMFKFHPKSHEEQPQGPHQ